jgi:hypothetical protein
MSIALALFVGCGAVEFRGLASLHGGDPVPRSRGGITADLGRLRRAVVRERRGTVRLGRALQRLNRVGSGERERFSGSRRAVGRRWQPPATAGSLVSKSR